MLLALALSLGTAQAGLAQDQAAQPQGSITWTMGTVESKLKTLPEIAGVDAAQAPGGNLVIVSSEVKSGLAVPVAWTSPDGLDWTRATLKLPKRWQGRFPSGAVLNAIAATPSGLTAVGGGLYTSGSGLMGSSVDGVEWKLQRLDEPVGFVAAEPVGEGLAVLGTNACPSPKACRRSGGIGFPSYFDAVEPDVTAWSATRIADKGQAALLAVDPDGVLVAAGVTPQGAQALWRSTDGLTWSVVVPDSETPSEGWPTDLAWTPAGFVMTVDNGADGGAAWVSPDGLTWDRAIGTDGAITTVGTAGADAIVFGDDRYWRSADGVAWEETAEPAFRHYTIRSLTTMDDGRLFLAGTGGAKAVKLASWIGEHEAPIP